ncbi:FtsW/RodA/SpoVE family cell cycle protein [Streptomyces radicis]|uniref:FtsW/RodA/SpoVE family cell cycle protein n=1 Tax=Streptomyces radicis TaxID=1750517 RepID=A0A3A9VTS6_9ACTN|nr:FtsW/RodA/SpoVE family cell cycle protein [Streptomyces radicis]RKN04169.1 FtsW/RodA/SpoVE family cell cycle protein [Streptomyces radicis]RKN14501.1 FtsW/RodA/SpoVE family cell cycle protein [Streptomyces radicis]
MAKREEGRDGAVRRWVAHRRNTELALIVFAIAIVAFGHSAANLAMEEELPTGLLAHTAGLGALAIAAHLAVRRFARYADPLILPVTVLLSGIGLVLLDRLDHAYAQQYPPDNYQSAPAAPDQVIWTVVGVGLLIATLVVLRHHRVLQRYTYLGMAVAMLLLMAPAFFGADQFGAKRWITVGPLSVQPGEFVKVMIVIFFASYLMANRDALALVGRRFLGLALPRGRNAGPVLLVWAVSLVVLFYERDLGTSLIFFGVFVLMLYVATERTSWVVLGGLMAALGTVVVAATQPHVKGRVQAWLDPMAIFLPEGERPPGLISDQSAQALFSFGAGDLTGTGLGEGHSYLIGFAGRSDFILATVGEELGLVGVTLVLLLYALLIQRGISAALSVTDPFGKLMAMGLSAVVALQVFIVSGGVTGLIPLTGKALPFLAQGGSSTVANWLLVALLIRVSDSAGKSSTEPAGNATILTPVIADPLLPPRTPRP